MKITRRGAAGWAGDFKVGRGALSTASGALDRYPYGFSSRFGDVKGSNPEELLGAAHAGCFTMALSMVLGEAGFVADSLDTTAEVTLEQVESGFAITAVHITLRGKVNGLDADSFKAMAAGAKANCPVSKTLKAEITLDAKLVS